MSTLVTGLSGFVGSYCAEHLSGVSDLLHDGRLAEICDREEVRSAVDGVRPDTVIHLAALSSVPASTADPAKAYRVNFEGTLNLLLALRDCGFRGRMLYVGSADAYGPVPETELPVAEDRPLRPLNAYAASKTAAEALCCQWSQSSRFEIIRARPFNHIGPRQGTRFAVADFGRQVAMAARGLSPAVLSVGDIDATRDFTDVRDIVRAYVLLLERGRNGQIYNVCSGTERSLRDLIGRLCALAGIQMQIKVAPERLRAVEQRRVRGSYAKLHAETGWEPAIPLAETLRDILQYWTERETR
jgi:GDP-4-dehydro-6-deoxy-D-mannose reductase